MIKFFHFLKNTASFATLKTLELGKNRFSTAFSDWGDKFENFIEKYKELPALESYHLSHSTSNISIMVSNVEKLRNSSTTLLKIEKLQRSLESNIR